MPNLYNQEAMELVKAAAILAAAQLQGKPILVNGPQSVGAVFNAALNLITHHYALLSPAPVLEDPHSTEK